MRLQPYGPLITIALMGLWLGTGWIGWPIILIVFLFVSVIALVSAH